MGHCKDLGVTPGMTGSCDDLERRRSGLLLRRDSRGKDGEVDASEGTGCLLGRPGRATEAQCWQQRYPAQPDRDTFRRQRQQDWPTD